MYIWIGCALPQNFEDELRAHTRPLAQALALDLEPFSLPQHISLKISFDAGDRSEEILYAVETLLRQETQFAVHPDSIVRQGNILWITFQENEILREIHNRLDSELQQQFGIGQHPFDRRFLFHSTVYIGEENKIALAEEKLQSLCLPKSLHISRFLLGVSPSGKTGTYYVVREVSLENG